MKGHHVTVDPPPISSPPSPNSTPQLLSSALHHNLHQSQPSLQISSRSSRPPINTMKRPSSSDSLIPSAFPLDDDGGGADEEMCSAGLGGGEKKRRLGADQVRALEKNFEVENKLDPDRKVRLAQELGLQPRQVAVWFQNRRARWKTKQLERDYSALKSSYDSLRVDFNSLQHENHSLLSQIKELKAKLGEADSCHSVKESTESDAKASEMEAEEEEEEEEPPALIYKEGSPDSDSSAVLNDDAGQYHHHTPAILSNAFPTGSSNHSSTPFSFQQQLLKMEEHGFEDPCSNIFTDDQPTSLPWYYPEQWSWLDVAGASAGAGETKDGAF